jgi:hypothetical protein
MANRTKTYFIAPSFDWVADDGPVKLGSIIASPSTPDEPISIESFNPPKIDQAHELNQLGSTITSPSTRHVRIGVESLNSSTVSETEEPDQPGNTITSASTPQKLLNVKASEPPKVYTRVELNWKDEKNRSHDGAIGIFAKFAEALPIGGGASTAYGKNKVDIYQFKKLETKYFIPTTPYIEKRVLESAVQDYLKEKKYRKRIYMITGLKIAHNPAAASLVSTTFTTQAKLGADLTALAVPVEIGTHGEISRKKGSATSFTGGSNFVFAFQLREITYKIVKGKPQIGSALLTDGAWYGLGNGKIVVGEEDGVVEEFRFTGLVDHDVKADSVEMTGEPVWDGDEICEGVLLASVLGSEA